MVSFHLFFPLSTGTLLTGPLTLVMKVLAWVTLTENYPAHRVCWMFGTDTLSDTSNRQQGVICLILSFIKESELLPMMDRDVEEQG